MQVLCHHLDNVPNPGRPGDWPLPRAHALSSHALPAVRGGALPAVLWVVAFCPGMCWYYNPSTGSWQVVMGMECPGPGWCWCLAPDGQWRFQIRICFGDCP
ncbi:MAG: hypothetical protein ABDI20_07005 [Candidatus Bipolaricaulaceae bacterium]